MSVGDQRSVQVLSDQPVQGGITYTFSYNGLGDRLQQTAAGEVTTYTLDLYAGLTQVLDDGTNVYLNGLGRIGEEQPGGWAYHLPDALGSVRQLADRDGRVTMVQSFKPYGGVLESEGDGASAYDFAGEWRDAYIKLIYLRSRYYAYQTGRFITRDTWLGDYTRPLSLNLWNYAEGNPINFTDSSGYKPKRNEIGTTYQYSCNCGWIDWDHATAGMVDGTSLAQRILRKLRTPIDTSLVPYWTGRRAIRVRSETWFEIPTAHGLAVIPENQLSDPDQLINIGLGIFMEHSEQVEDFHSTIPQRYLASSAYSEEDLPSNLIGFYIALQMDQGMNLDDAVKQVKELCGAMTEAESEYVFDEVYGGLSGFREYWYSWHPRFLPPNNSCGFMQSCFERKEPEEIFGLLSRAQHSINDGRASYKSSTWSWGPYYGRGLMYPVNEQEGVYAMISQFP